MKQSKLLGIASKSVKWLNYLGKFLEIAYKVTIYLLMVLQVYLHKRNGKKKKRAHKDFYNNVHSSLNNSCRLNVIPLCQLRRIDQLMMMYLCNGYCTGITWNKLLMQTMTWTTFENITLSKITQTQKIHRMPPIYKGKTNL